MIDDRPEQHNPDGGSAFPYAALSSDGRDVVVTGMSLRDYLAGQALTGYRVHKIDWQAYPPEVVAGWCCADADALIAELRKP